MSVGVAGVMVMGGRDAIFHGMVAVCYRWDRLRSQEVYMRFVI
jgi:hypothetical protein